MPLYLQQAGASYAVVGTVISALELGRLLAALPSSGLLTRLGMRWTMLVGLAVVTVALLVMTRVSSIPVIFGCWLLAGVGLTLFELSRHQFIAMKIANVNRGRAVAVIGGLFRLGNVVGPVTGGWVAQTAGFEMAFLVMAGCGLATAVAVFLFVPTRTTPAAPFSLSVFGAELWETLRLYRRVLLVAGGGQLMLQLVRRTRGVIVPLYAANMLGLDVATIGLVVGIGSTLDALLFLPAGMIVDRYGRKMAIIPSLLMQAVGLLLLPLATGLASLVAVVGLLGLGNGISAGTMLTLGADLTPSDRRAPFLGLWRISGSLGFALGPNIVGTVAGLLTLPLASVTVGGIGLLAAFLFYRFVPETLERPLTTVSAPDDRLESGIVSDTQDSGISS